MTNRHRASTRYRYGSYRGKKIGIREAHRRIAQSFGYKFGLQQEQQEQPKQEIKSLIL